MRKYLLILVLVLALPVNLYAKEAATTAAAISAPKDFRFSFQSRAGTMDQATEEKITVQGKLVTLDRSAKVVGESGDKKPFQKTYDVTPEQLDALYQIVQQSGVMTWPNSAEGGHQSEVQESIEVSADGKTVKHGRWEAGNQEKFRVLYEQFNTWYTDIRSVRF